MTDFLGAMLTGLFTGIGVYLANYLGEKHLRAKLDAINTTVARLKEDLKK